MNPKHPNPSWQSWTTAQLFSVDTETTGLSPHHDRVVEIGAVRCSLGGPRETAIDIRIDPFRPIPPKVSAINGIVDRDVADSPSFDEVFGMFNELNDAETPRQLWIGNNADFDHSMLASELARSMRGVRLWSPVWLDVKVLCKAIDGATRFDRGYRMAMMLPRFGLEYRGRAHSALVDAHANLDLLQELVRRYPKQLPTPLAALELQAHWLDTAG